MLYYYKNEFRTPKTIDLEWINRFIYCNVSSFVAYMFAEKFDTNGKFHNPLAKKDHAVYYQIGKPAILKNGKDYAGKVTVFDGNTSTCYSNFFNMLVAFIYALQRKATYWESEWKCCKDQNAFKNAMDKTRKWLETFEDEEIDADKDYEEISKRNYEKIEVIYDLNKYGDYFKKHYEYYHGNFEKNFEDAYQGFKFRDFGCENWEDFKEKYLILASDGYVKSDITGTLRYSKSECEEFGIYCLKWFRDYSILNRIKTSNSALYFLLLNYYLFELKDNMGRLVAIRWRYRFDEKKKAQLEKGGSGRKVEKYQNMTNYKQKFVLNNLENFVNQQEDDNLILIESFSDIPACYRKFNNYGDHFVSTGTAGLTLEQINILHYLKIIRPNLKIFLGFDSDEAGKKKKTYYLKELRDKGFECEIINFNGKDWETNNVKNIEDLKFHLFDACEIFKDVSKEKKKDRDEIQW